MDFSEIEGPVREAARTLERDGAKVAVTKQLTRELLVDLAAERLCAIHVKGFFAPALATRAARALTRLGRHEIWAVDGRKTDTMFNIGLPRQMGEGSKRAAARYRREADRANAAIRRAFRPGASPIDMLRLQLEELWPSGSHLARFEGEPALAGLVRTIEPQTLLPGVAGTLGIIHVDETRKPGQARRMSSNLYLAMPPEGGTLRIWDVATGKANQQNLAHMLCSRFGFEAGSQEILHAVLPRPFIVRPRPGDLVLLDTARPHAVGGFTRGRRMSLQSWVIAPGKPGPLTVFA